jgi:putative ABC transport system permease protein
MAWVGSTGYRFRAVQQIVGLAWADFTDEGRISFCSVLALMAMLAPLLVLFGLRFGVIDTIARRLVEDPRNREILGVGSGRFDGAWFADMAARPEVAFVIPNTRRIAASFSSLENDAKGARLPGVQMIPTGPGDPLLADVPAPATGGEGEAVTLSDLTARKLGVAAGDSIDGFIQRQRGSQIEQVSLRLKVAAIAPESAWPDEAVFLPLELLVATEDYRDGFAVPALGWPGAELPERARIYPRFRLYAASIYDVGALRDTLMAAGIEVRTQADDVEAMQALDRNLGRIFWLIAATAASGFLAALAASLVANIDRKRRELSVLRLVGFTTGSIMVFPMVQAVLVAVLGAAVALAAYAGIAAVLNGYFTTNLRGGERICRLLPGHIAIAVGVTVACAIVASAWAGLRAARIEPAEGIRDV